MASETKAGGQVAKRFDPTTLGGHAALATNETMPSTIWKPAVELAAIHAAKDSDAMAALVREPEMRTRLSTWWADGVPVWMAVSTLLGFADGRAAAARECDPLEDMRRALRRAVRS